MSAKSGLVDKETPPHVFNVRTNSALAYRAGAYEWSNYKWGNDPARKRNLVCDGQHRDETEVSAE